MEFPPIPYVGWVLPREQTLEQLGFGESPELELTLREKPSPSKNGKNCDVTLYML